MKKVKSQRLKKKKSGRIIVSPNCAVCGSKNQDLLKSMKLVDFLNYLLRVRSPVEGIPVLGNIMSRYKVDKIINKFLPPGSKFMPGMHLSQSIFT